MHPSVRIRFGLANLGVEDCGPYLPPALKQWKLMGAEKDADGSTTDRKTGPIWWQYIGSDSRFDSNPNKLYEDELGDLELELLRHDSTAFGGSVPHQYAERLFSLSQEFSS